MHALRRLFAPVLFVAAAPLLCHGQATLTMPDMPLHDPYILANTADHTYYLYTSNVGRISGTEGAGTMVYRSTDLRHWQPPQAVFTVPPGAFGKDGGWAPEVHRYRGRFYLLTTFHDKDKPLTPATNGANALYRRGTMIAVADSPMGPFTLLHPDTPVPPADRMTLDGTLYVDPAGKPWMVYAHEWLQMTDGTMEAVPLSADLSRAVAAPTVLFHASEGQWLSHDAAPAANYVTDGPQLFRTHDGHLLMLWSSYEHGSYLEAEARSASGTIAGPWQQLPPLVRHDSGHGMLFRGFDGTLMLVMHHPFKQARGRLFEVHDAGDHLEVVRERLDLDGASDSLVP